MSEASKLNTEEQEKLSELIEGQDTELDPEQLEKTPEEINLSFEFENVQIDYSDVVGMEEVKQKLDNKIKKPIRAKEKLRQYGINSTVNGVILYGPPGTGKTIVSKAFAGETGFRLLHVNSADLKSKKVGKSESNFRELFNQAVQFQPCIILLNEVDTLASDRDERKTSNYKRDMVGAFLEEMEQLEGEDVSVIATTNFINRVDDAFFNSIRFSEKIWVGMPDLEMRKEIIKENLEPVDDEKIDGGGIDLDRVAELSEGMNCADLASNGLCYNAKMKAFREGEKISQSHLLYGWTKTQASVDNPDKFR